MKNITDFKNSIINMDKKSILITILSIFLIIWIILIETNLIEAFDTSIYNLIIQNMNGNLTTFFMNVTTLSSPLALSGLCILILIMGFILKKRNIGITIFCCVLFNSIVSEVLKIIIHRPRPDILRLVVETSYSFPSGHTLASTSLSGILIYFILKSGLNKNIKIILTILLLLFPILVATSRVYLGVHYPSDVLGGMLIAIILLLIEISIIEKKDLF